MKVEAGGYLKIDLYGADATHLINALIRIAEKKGEVGFKMYGLKEEEIDVITNLLDELG